MSVTLKQLMESVGCKTYPEIDMERIFDMAMKEYDENGCFLTDLSYYDYLHEKYGCFEKYMDVYKAAAMQVAEDEMLGRFLTLFVMVIHDADSDAKEWKKIGKPVAPQGKPVLGYEMVLGLAMCTQLDSMYERLRVRNIPDEIIRDTMKLAVNSVSTHERKNNGEPGFDLFEWCQLYVCGRLYLIERLEIEFLGGFSPRAKVYKNANGEMVVLAHDIKLHRDGMTLGSIYYEDEEGSWTAMVEETDAEYIGYPVKEDGWVSKEKITLSKNEWNKVVERGDSVIRLHIPPFGKLTPELVERTIAATKNFAAKYYPEFKYKAFTCHSWLIDPQLEKLVGADSNISKFMNMFTKITCKSKGEDVFNFIFNKPDMNFDIKDLPENTRLHRALKKHYLSGKAIYEVHGFFVSKT